MAENFALGIVEALRKRFEPAAKSERRSFFRF
jgi:hypothetical protein